MMTGHHFHHHPRVHAYGWDSAIAIANERALVRGVRQRVRPCRMPGCPLPKHFTVLDVDSPRAGD